MADCAKRCLRAACAICLTLLALAVPLIGFSIYSGRNAGATLFVDPSNPEVSQESNANDFAANLTRTGQLAKNITSTKLGEVYNSVSSFLTNLPGIGNQAASNPTMGEPALNASSGSAVELPRSSNPAASSPASEPIENGKLVRHTANESRPLQPRAVPSSVLCAELRKAPSKKTSALSLFCQEAPGYPEIWAEGMLTLGEKALLNFVQHWRQHRAQLGGKQVLVWYDRRDSKASAMLHEQVSDTYGLKKRLSGAGDKWILDFGGNAGFTAICEANLAPDAHVLTIEPSPWTYLVLRANLAQARLHERVIALRGGMGGQPGNLYGVHYFTASAGVHVRVAAEKSSDDRPGAFTAPIFTLPELIKKYSIDHIALVKLDCEGCEYSSVPAWLEDGLSDRIPQMVGEFHHSAFKNGKAIQDWPKEWTLAEAKRLYKFLCGSSFIAMEKGCRHGRRDPLHEDHDSSGEH